MKNYNFKRRNLFSGPHLLGLLFIAAGIFSIISPAIFKSASSLEKSLWVGTGAIILGSIVVSSYGGTLIDLQEKRVQEYFSFLGYKFGKWTDLPDILSIKVIAVSYKTTNTPNGISPTWSGNVTAYKALLYSNDPTPILSFIYSKKERAIKDAELLSAGFNTTLELSLKE